VTSSHQTPLLIKEEAPFKIYKSLGRNKNIVMDLKETKNQD
jgi:hypothetical protein